MCLGISKTDQHAFNILPRFYPKWLLQMWKKHSEQLLYRF